MAGRRVLRGVSFAARAGESVALLGPNGSGKTTLLRVISGVLRPESGHLSLKGKPLEQLRPRSRAGSRQWCRSAAKFRPA